jgi:hypothetical protein
MIATRTKTKAKTKAKLLPLPMREGARGRGRSQVALPPAPKPRGNRSCIVDPVWILSDGPARNAASKSDTEFHGVRHGVPRSRSYALYAESHGTVPVALREAPKPSTPWNSVPYSVKLRVGLTDLPRLAPNPTRSRRLPCPMREGGGGSRHPRLPSAGFESLLSRASEADGVFR